MALAQEQPRRAALDTKVLFAERFGISHHTKAIQVLRKKLRLDLIICPSVLVEIAATETESADREQRERARLVRQEIEDSDCDCPAFTDTQKAVTKMHVSKILARNVLPGGSRQDVRVLVEAAYMNCQMLVTTRLPLLQAHAEDVGMALVDCDLPPVSILSSHNIIDF